MSEIIEVTPSQKKVLEIIEGAIRKNEKITMKEIAHRTGLSVSAVSGALSGRKDKSLGLYSKVPELRDFIVLNVRSGTKEDYDVSFIKNSIKSKK